MLKFVKIIYDKEYTDYGLLDINSNFIFAWDCGNSNRDNGFVWTDEKDAENHDYAAYIKSDNFDEIKLTNGCLPFSLKNTSLYCDIEGEYEETYQYNYVDITSDKTSKEAFSIFFCDFSEAYWTGDVWENSNEFSPYIIEKNKVKGEVIELSESESEEVFNNTFMKSINDSLKLLKKEEEKKAKENKKKEYLSDMIKSLSLTIPTRSRQNFINYISKYKLTKEEQIKDLHHLVRSML